MGVKKNKKLYLETLNKGKDLGITKAINLLADIYSSGQIIEEDQTKALELYEECAEKGSVQCQFITAMMCEEGIGTAPNKNKASYWFDVYSMSQLTSFQLSAIDILKENYIPNSIDYNSLFKILRESKDPRVLLELCIDIQKIQKNMKKMERLSSMIPVKNYPNYIEKVFLRTSTTQE